MSQRRRTAALLAAGVTCLLSAALPMVTAHAAGEPGSGLGSFGMSAVAHGVQLTIGEPTYCFTTPSGTNGCEGDLPHAESELANGPIGSGTASIAWPGSLAADAGSLAVTAGAPSQATAADYPNRAYVKTGSTPDTVTNTMVQGSTMKAQAKATTTSAEAHVNSLSAAGVGTFGPTSGITNTSLVSASKAVAKAASNVSDINLAAGVVHIGSVQSTVEASSDGKTGAAKGTTTVSGATVAGVPVTIDENGVSANGNGLTLDALNKTVNDALVQGGITLLVSAPQKVVDGASVVYTSGGLVFVFKQMGYQTSVVLGNASASVRSTPALVFPTSGGSTGGSVPGTTGGHTIGSSSGGSTGAVGTSGGGLLSGVGSTGGSVTPPVTDPGSVPLPSTVDPILAASPISVGTHPLGPLSVLLGLLGSGLLLAGLRRLPDRILETTAPVCPLEETV
jgi:hypothetical protein